MATAAVSHTGDHEEVEIPRWPWIAGTILSVLGLGVSAYLTYEHYTGSKSLACPAGKSGGAINCLAVTTSTWSMEHGIPVAVLGLVYFVVMLGLQSPWAWRWTRREVLGARLVWCAVGIAMAVKLVYDELFKIHAICEWCTSVHVITLILFIATVFGTLSVTSPAYEESE